MVKQTFRVPDMHCSSCVMALEELEDELEGVVRVDASYQKQQMVVEYNEAQVSEEQIVRAARELGYKAIPLQVPPA